MKNLATLFFCVFGFLELALSETVMDLRKYDTAALMAQYVPTGTKGVILLGKTTPGDSGGGTFYFSPASAMATNSDTVFAAPWGAANGRWIQAPSVATGGGGTVTSVAQTVPSFLTIAGSPIIGAGTLAIGLANTTSNKFLAGPINSGAAAAPSMRLIDVTDLASGIGASASTYLRGDWTWATPSGGGGGGGTVGTVVNSGASTTLKFLQYTDATGTNVSPVAFSGDLTVAAGGASTLKNTGTAGTYTKTTFDAQGRETSGTSATLASSDYVNQGATTTLLHGNAAGNPSWSQVSLTADVIGVLPTANGGSIVGTMINSGASTTLKIPQYSDTTGTNFSPIAFSGDMTLAAGGTATLKNTGTAGTYTKITFDAQGRETSGASASLASADFANQGTTTTVLHGNAAGNPSFGAVSLTADVSGNLPVGNLNSGTSASASTFWRGDGTWGTPPGLGTVTSVGLTMPSIFSVSGSPVTTSGTLAATLATESANTVWAGPTSGGAATPTFRSLVTADLPAGIGTVTSVAASVPSFLSISGSPVTTSGTLAFGLQNQSSNKFLAGPISNGAAAAPTFRGLDISDFNSGSAASSSTFWRGDGTWATPTGGSVPTGTGFTHITSGSQDAAAVAVVLTSADVGTIATASVLGRNTAGTGAPEVLTTLPNGIQDAITRLGTVTSGVWNGTAVPITAGGSGQATAAAAFTALAPTAGNSGEIIQWNGSAWAVRPNMITRTGAAVDVVSTGSETSLFTNSIPANALGTNRMARLVIDGDVLNNTGGNATFAFKLYYGSTTVHSSSCANIASNASRRPMRMMIEFMNLDASNSQLGVINLNIGTGTALSASSLQNAWVNGTSAVDSTAAQGFGLTVTPSTNASTASFKLMHASLIIE